MTNLNNGLQFQSIFFPDEFGNYLIANGFDYERPSSDTLRFQKDGVVVYVKNECVDVFRLVPEANDGKGLWVFTQSHTGISKIDQISWIMLMQLMGVQMAIESFTIKAA